MGNAIRRGFFSCRLDRIRDWVSGSSRGNPAGRVGPPAGGGRRIWRGSETALLLGIGFSAVASLITGFYFSSNFFFGDDFPLISDAIRGTSAWTPVSTHLRPLVRLHFHFFLWFPSPLFFHLCSLLLHAFGSWTAFLVYREFSGKSAALLGGLLFFTCFAGNEAVYWVASVGILYCLIFSNLSILMYRRDRVGACFLFLLLALLSYELWIVVPFLMVFRLRRRVDLWIPLAAFCIQASLHLWNFGFGIDSYGGFSLADLPDRFSVYAIRFVSPLSEFSPGWFGLLVTAGIAALIAWRKYRFPVVWYSVSALLLGFSAVIPLRFHYFPGIALVFFLISLTRESRSWIRYPGVFLAFCVAVSAPVMNLLDGRDYRDWGEGHRLFQGWVSEAVVGLDRGNRVTLLNRVDQKFALSLIGNFRGRPKTVFIRPRAIGGLVDPDVAVRIGLYPNGFRALPSSCSRKTIILGRDALVSKECFTIIDL